MIQASPHIVFSNVRSAQCTCIYNLPLLRTLVKPVADLAREFKVGSYLAQKLNNDSIIKAWLRDDPLAAAVSTMLISLITLTC